MDFDSSTMITCMVARLGRDIGEVELRYKECKVDIWCWVKTVGSDAFECGFQCLLPYKETSIAQQTDVQDAAGEYFSASFPTA